MWNCSSCRVVVQVDILIVVPEARSHGGLGGAGYGFMDRDRMWELKVGGGV
jgi:hypothetical protein